VRREILRHAVQQRAGQDVLIGHRPGEHRVDRGQHGTAGGVHRGCLNPGGGPRRGDLGIACSGPGRLLGAPAEFKHVRGRAQC